MIPESDVERAVNWLVENANRAAQARAQREYLQEYRKTLKALIMREHESLPLVAQEREAYADQRYVAHLLALRDAIEDDEKLRWLRTAAETKVEAWRSMNANMRTNV